VISHIVVHSGAWILPLSTIFQLDFGNVSTVWYFYISAISWQ